VAVNASSAAGPTRRTGRTLRSWDETDREIEIMPFSGSCHCGALAYDVDEALPTQALDCNCSICRRKGTLHHFTTPDRFAFRGQEEAISVYTFRTHNIQHQFCRVCGCAPFAKGVGPDGKRMVEINLRCVDGLDLKSLTIVPYDGASA
jgi:hypothetical protein